MKEALSAMQRFWRLLKIYRPEIAQIYLYAILSGLVNLSLPIGIQAIINMIQGGEPSNAWLVLVAFVLTGIGLTGVFQILQLRIVENIQQNIFARSAFEFAYRLPKIKLLELDRLHAPELVNRFFDTLTIQKGLPKILIDFSLAAFQVIFGLILLAFYSPYFIALGAISILILIILLRLIGPRGLATSLKESKYKYQLAHWLEEIAHTNRSFKLSTNSILHLQKTDAIAMDYLGAREKHFRVLLSQFGFFIAFKVFAAAGLLVLGSLLVFEERLNIGQFVAAEIIILLIINSIEKLIRSIETIYDVLTALEKIGYITDLTLESYDGITAKDLHTGPSVQAKNLSFAYDNMRNKLIKNLSFEVPPQNKVLIKGESGSGKSTLLQIIGGLFDFDEGALLINDRPIQNYNKNELFEQVGFCFSNDHLFKGSIKDNITLGRPVSDAHLLEVVDALYLSAYIKEQHKGLLTEIDPEGSRLSRSISQKILLARALSHQPSLLIMEDPLQFINSEEKARIIDYIMHAERKWTAFIISNYTYWEFSANQVITLQKGFADA